MKLSILLLFVFFGALSCKDFMDVDVEFEKPKVRELLRQIIQLAKNRDTSVEDLFTEDFEYCDSCVSTTPCEESFLALNSFITQNIQENNRLSTDIENFQFKITESVISTGSHFVKKEIMYNGTLKSLDGNGGIFFVVRHRYMERPQTYLLHKARRVDCEGFFP